MIGCSRQKGLTLPTATRSISGIAEDDFGYLHFSVNGSAFVVSDIRVCGVPEPCQNDILHGDVNLDGVVDLLDIAPFVALLTGNGFQPEADINKDGAVDLLDIAPLVDLITS